MNKISKEAFLVHETLLKHGLENPLINNVCKISIKKRKKLIIYHISKIMYLLNLNIKDESIVDTPGKISKMYIEDIFFGLDYINFPSMSFNKNKIRFNDIITVSKINLTTICEHHFLIIDGEINVSYIPKNKIIGLSKINSIIHFFAARPQLQERLTKQILVVLQTLLETDNVAVSMNAIHHCVKSRGVCDKNSITNTISLGGLFKKNKTIRQEFQYYSKNKK